MAQTLTSFLAYDITIQYGRGD